MKYTHQMWVSALIIPLLGTKVRGTLSLLMASGEASHFPCPHRQCWTHVTMKPGQPATTVVLYVPEYRSDASSYDTVST